MNAAPNYQTTIGATSLIVGPALMSVGDLFHPPETRRWLPRSRSLHSSASRWYAAHLLLFVGMLVLVPGLLALTRVARIADPRQAMLRGFSCSLRWVRFPRSSCLRCSSGASSPMAPTRQPHSSCSKPSSGRALRCARAGSACVLRGDRTGRDVTRSSEAGPFRWPALGFGLGASLILGEIILAEVLLSQIGNLVILAAGIAFAWLLLRGRELAPV